MTEEYFITLNDYNINNNLNHTTNKTTNITEKFIELSNNPKLADISKTIAINCNDYYNTINKIMINKPDNSEVLDTPYYARYKPLEYDKNRKYYWKRNKLIEEGIRRSQDDDKDIANIESLLNNEINTNNNSYKKKILQDELNLFGWRSSNPFIIVEDKTGIPREKQDIISDYYPEEIGLQRPWIERHSHIPDYSY